MSLKAFGDAPVNEVAFLSRAAYQGNISPPKSGAQLQKYLYEGDETNWILKNLAGADNGNWNLKIYPVPMLLVATTTKEMPPLLQQKKTAP